MKKVINSIIVIALCAVSLTACIQVVSPTPQPQETAVTQPPVQQTAPAAVPAQVPQTQPVQVPQTQPAVPAQPVVPQVPMQGGYQLPQFAITIDQAKAIVLNASGFNEANVTFVKQKQDYDDGMPEYEIEFVANNMKYEFEVNGVTGAITKQEIDTVFD